MRAAVRAAFYPFNEPMEGAVPWFYQDVKGLVSIGVGVLCDPIELTLGLPMLHLDGSPASRLAIVTEWQIIKALPPNAQGQTAAQLGHTYAHPHTKLRLPAEGLRSTLERKLDANDAILRHHYPEFEEWPADAQMGLHSLAWACGPNLPPGWPKLTAALRERDFRTAATECFMPEEATISGLRPRNKANARLFRNAAVAAAVFDPEELFYPRDLDALANTPPDTLPAQAISLDVRELGDEET